MLVLDSISSTSSVLARREVDFLGYIKILSGDCSLVMKLRTSGFFLGDSSSDSPSDSLSSSFLVSFPFAILLPAADPLRAGFFSTTSNDTSSTSLSGSSFCFLLRPFAGDSFLATDLVEDFSSSSSFSSFFDLVDLFGAFLSSSSFLAPVFCFFAAGSDAAGSPALRFLFCGGLSASLLSSTKSILVDFALVEAFSFVPAVRFCLLFGFVTVNVKSTSFSN